MNSETPLLSADTLNETETTLNQNKKDEDNNNDEKNNIKKHPLFPLLEYFLVKCEEATFLLATSEIIEKELKLIALRQKKLCGSLTTGDYELDSLMMNALKNLNFQHHELRKVDDLCDDFLHRYSARLRARFAQESLFCLADFENELPPSDLANMLNFPPMATIQTSLGPICVPLTRNNDFTTLDRKTDLASSEKPLLDEEKDLCNVVSTSNALLNKNSLMPQINVSVNLESVDLKTKRNSLPRRSVELLRSWLFQNMTHPYPSDEEKHRLSVKTGLNLTQVNNWFINARRRILQPLLDGNSSRLSPEVSASLRSHISKLQGGKHAGGSSNESTSTVDDGLTSDDDVGDNDGDERSRSPIRDDDGPLPKLKAIRPAFDAGRQKLCSKLTKSQTPYHLVSSSPVATKLTSNYRSIDELIGSPKRTNTIFHSLINSELPSSDQQRQEETVVPKSTSNNYTVDDESRSTNSEHHVIEQPVQNTKQKSRKRSLKVDSPDQNLNSLIDGVA